MIKFFKKGDTIIKDGDTDREAYIIESGEVEVLKNDIQLCILEKHSIFGEIGWLEHIPRTATVKALTDCHLYVVKPKDAPLLIEHNPKALIPILKIVCNRMSEMLEKIGKAT